VACHQLKITVRGARASGCARQPPPFACEQLGTVDRLQSAGRPRPTHRCGPWRCPRPAQPRRRARPSPRWAPLRGNQSPLWLSGHSTPGAVTVTSVPPRTDGSPQRQRGMRGLRTTTATSSPLISGSRCLIGRHVGALPLAGEVSGGTGRIPESPIQEVSRGSGITAGPCCDPSAVVSSIGDLERDFHVGEGRL
jgi:hypothetical protein